MFLILLLLALLGMPLFAVIALGAMGGYWQADLDPMLVAMDFVRLGESSVLVALPAFAFAGFILARSGTPQRIVDLTRSALGGRPGSQAVGFLMLGTLLAALTGPSGLVLIALGGLLRPVAHNGAGSEGVSRGLVSSGAAPGAILAPALPLVLYALIAGQVAPRADLGVAELLLAGALPALLLVILLGGYAAWLYRDLPDAEPDYRPLGGALRENAWELPLPVLLVGGIYAGWLGLADAAVVAAAWLVVTLVLIRRELRAQDLPGIVTESMVPVAGVLVLFGLSMASTSLVVDAGLAQQVSSWVEPFFDSRLAFVMAAVAGLLVVGAVIDVFAALVLVSPLLIPVAAAFGVNPVHFGVLCVVSLQLGRCIPTAGRDLFMDARGVGAERAGSRRALLVWAGILLLHLSIIAAAPGLALGLPSLLGG